MSTSSVFISGIVRVDGGRGFVVNGASRSLILTAAHCLPHFPPAMSFSRTEERTYANLVGPLGEKPTIWVECLFADPIADIAILGEPDGQMLHEESLAYDELIEQGPRMQIAAASEQESLGWLLSLENRWFQCSVKRDHNGGLVISKSQESIEGGMSGSPILNDDGLAIGIITSNDWSNPGFPGSLPGWASEQFG